MYLGYTTITIDSMIQSSLRALRRMATFRRTMNLLRAFPEEQKHPEVFYSLLAKDTAQFIAAASIDVRGVGLAGQKILDVGGGPGYFAQAFDSYGAWYVPVEPDAGEMSAAGIENAAAVRADGRALPFADNSFDIVYSSNVAEHVENWEAMGDDMLRVTKPGGLVVISYTVWLGPFGGHETGLWEHYVGGHFARRRYEKRHGHPPKNVFGESMFAVSCASGLRFGRRKAQASEGPPASPSTGPDRKVYFLPRYHPWWAWWIVRVPLLREFLTSNLVIIIRK